MYTSRRSETVYCIQYKQIINNEAPFYLRYAPNVCAFQPHLFANNLVKLRRPSIHLQRSVAMRKLTDLGRALSKCHREAEEKMLECLDTDLLVARTNLIPVEGHGHFPTVAAEQSLRPAV